MGPQFAAFLLFLSLTQKLIFSVKSTDTNCNIIIIIIIILLGGIAVFIIIFYLELQIAVLSLLQAFWYYCVCMLKS